MPHDFSHLVIGGGVVGLAIAARLARTAANSVLLVERHSQVGTETSARNSEVIHAGLYHPPESLRTKLCIKGKNMLYEVASKSGIEYKQCGKWVVAQDEKQHEYLHKMYQRARDFTGVPLEWVSLSKASQLEPSIIAKAAILNSPTTGIVSAHSLMTYYEGQIEQHGGDIALNTAVVAIRQNETSGYTVSCKSDDSSDPIELTATCVINSAGLNAPNISNLLLPKERHVTAYYGKGNYFAYTHSQPKVNRLIYPCPSDHGSLGTHLTLDLNGRLKFGPDFEWVNSADDLQVNGQNLETVKQEISKYIKLDTSALVADYAGIRPKITQDSSKFHDFVIREEHGFPGFVNLLNIESPGLTSSLAIAEYVETILHQ
ncbi:FAD-dependent oxidoreductase, putative [Sugiyamaella lignohabitans]|uniref:L-2-hydroxyglutarate dehydrogenase, mitochondrial n=1 Tax=Sugiyamaella lignohabitans TaxID=796027 RepID=A0A167ELS3_9ASCO|nr:FAD-dependent oxidoreductase, putative [Sugiyamaella lignohabitans]ANB14228.1 FAD-dependent oxidoreductase, putative [Sugiyamaella lignohabitans]